MKDYFNPHHILTFTIGQNIDFVNYDFVLPEFCNTDLYPVEYTYYNSVPQPVRRQAPFSQITKIEKTGGILYKIHCEEYDYENNTVSTQIYTTGKNGYLPVLLISDPSDENFSFKFVPASLEIKAISEYSISFSFSHFLEAGL